jgi:hypothetical protein
VLKQFKLQISICGLLLKQQFTEDVTQSMVDDAETQKLLHSPWSTMLKKLLHMVDDAEEVVTQSMVDDAETQKLLHSPWSTMLKHRGSCYIVYGQRC